jgi:hypothetical protein
VIDHAVELTQRHRLRGYDAVQLATALVASETLQAQTLHSPVFVAADGDLLAAATAERLSIESPLNYLHLDPQAVKPEPDVHSCPA